jgi:hypothetical protein
MLLTFAGLSNVAGYTFTPSTSPYVAFNWQLLLLVLACCWWIIDGYSSLQNIGLISIM